MSVLIQIFSITLLLFFLLPFQSLLKESDCWGKISNKRFVEITRQLHTPIEEQTHIIYQLGCQKTQRLIQNQLEFTINDKKKIKLKNISK
jgi:hypothetical protein